MALRIAFGGIHTECSTYSPLVMEASDFRVVAGEALAPELGLAIPDDAGIEAVPLFHARALPGGPVAGPVYRRFKTDFLAALQQNGPLDGLLLLMHGAMYVEGMEDAEGDWIGAVRETVGEHCRIAVSYDLHGNVSPAVVDAIDIFCAYRTAPHIDVVETHRRALTLLLDSLDGGLRPGVAWAPIPVLLPGERTSTEDEPAKSLYAALPDYDARPGVLDASIMVGYVWADEPRATAAAVVTGTDPEAAKEAAGEIAARYWSARRDFAFGMRAGPLEDMLDIVADGRTGPTILADSGDNPTGGGVGDRVDVLSAMLDRNWSGALVAGIADPGAALACAEAGQGASLEIAIGGALTGNGGIAALPVWVDKIIGSPEAGDLEVLVYVDNFAIVITQRRRPYHHLSDFAALGLNVRHTHMVVVKSGYLSPELAPIANPSLMALTDGAVNQDIPSLANRRRTRPIFPFDEDFDWRPTVFRSRRWIV